MLLHSQNDHKHEVLQKANHEKDSQMLKTSIENLSFEKGYFALKILIKNK